MRRPHLGEFSWKIFWVTAVWSAVLFPAFLIGPIRVTIGPLPMLLDPGYLLVVLGGILFGAWGGVLSPVVAASVAFAWHHEVPLVVFLASLPLQMLNGTVLPLARLRLLPGVRHLRVRAVAVYIFWGLLAMPLLNGAYYAAFGGHYFWGGATGSPWASLAAHAVYYALLILFPGEPLFRVAAREARDLGFLLEDRWSRWSPRRVFFRRRGRMVLALGLCMAPVLLLSVLAQQTLTHRRYLLQQNWVMQRMCWHASLGQTLARRLDSLRATLDVCAVEARRLRGSSDALSAFLLQVLKANPDILLLEYVPPDTPDADRRRTGYLGATAPITPAETAPARLARGEAGRWFLALGVPVPLPGSAEPGWLWTRARGDALVETIERHRGRFAAHASLVLLERGGPAMVGRADGLDLRPGTPARFFTAPDGRRCFVGWHPLWRDRWDLYYVEVLDGPPGLQDAMAEQALWAGAIHLFLLMMLFGLTLLARAIPVQPSHEAAEDA